MQSDCILYKTSGNTLIDREIELYLGRLKQQFPVIAILGPRQSGKTTVSRKFFKNYAYVSLEDLDTRTLALQDPRQFLTSFHQYEGVIIDEIQEVPALLSYMQGIVDAAYLPGFFVITGSQNFLLQEQITQTLAGRIALLTLLPLSFYELEQAKVPITDLNALLMKGFYPRTYFQPIDYKDWFSNYIATYVERDVRQVLKIQDVVTFQRFIKVCAARVGSILNYADLARDCDISLNTAKSWISVLESSYIIKLLYPYYKNFNKRVIKSPKIYFYDTGLICALLGIKDSMTLDIHPMKGPIFESFIVSEIFKYGFNHNNNLSLFFWRDVQGHEIDLVFEKSFDQVIPIEIKSRMTISDDFFKNLKDWHAITKSNDSTNYVIYAGKDSWKRSQGSIFSWKALRELLSEITN